MALTTQEFIDGCHYLTSVGALVPANPNGALFIDGDAQIVLDESDSNANITPNEATILQALTDLATHQTENQQVAQAAQIAVQQGKDYLQKQYLSASPNLTTIYNTLSSAVASNAYLTQIMDNQIAVYQLETGANLAVINTNAQRARYIECVRRVIALLA
jgi:hypothetical protein